MRVLLRFPSDSPCERASLIAVATGRLPDSHEPRNTHQSSKAWQGLRGFGGRGCNCGGGLIAGPRRLERHAPVQLTVGTIRNLRRAAEVEIRAPRLADRPAAVALLKVEKLLWSRGLLSGLLIFLAMYILAAH